MAQFDSDGDEIPDFLRAFDDTKKTRQLIYDGMLDAVKKRFPVENDEYRIELSNVRYTGPKDYSLKQIKDALLKNRKLRTPMSGTWRLVHKPTNTVVDERDDVLMHVPYYTDRGTLISNGNEYTVVNQARLRAGVYARRKKSGEYEAQFNTKPGTGPGFHVEMAPSTGVFTLTSGQAHIPLYSVLRGLGVDDGAISRAWGSDIAAANAKKHDPRAMRRLYARLAGRKAVQNLSDFETVDFVKNALSKTELDEDVVQRTMGLEGVKSVTPELLLRASQKILNISRGDEQEDKRDAPRFAQVYSIEDFLRERVDKDSGKLSQQLLWRAKRDRNLGRIPRGALNPYIDQFLNGTGLALPGEEASPLSNYVQMHRLTRLGQGGIGSIDLVTDEARDVQGDYLGFVDPVAGPECFVPGSFIFTNKGFIRVEDVTLDTEVACNIAGKLEFHRPERVIAEPYSGLVYEGKSDYVHYKVTPTHRLWCQKLEGNRKYRFLSAAEGSKCQLGFMCGGHGAYEPEVPYTEVNIPYVTCPTNNFKSKPLPPIEIGLFCRFLGWFISEGNTDGESIEITQSLPTHLDDLKDVLQKMPIEFRYDGKKFRVGNRSLAAYLQKLGRSWEKYIPEEFFEAPAWARKLLLDSLCYGDGRHKRDTFSYCTISNRLAEDVERLCISLGISCNMRFERDDRDIARRTHGTWVVHVNKRHMRALYTKNRYRLGNYSEEYYCGKVYCVTVPGGLVYARYGDRGAHWTGNSPSAGVDVRIAGNTYKGNDGQLYSKMLNMRTGKKEYVSLAKAADHRVAFPGQDPNAPYLYAMKDNVPTRVPRDEVDYMVPSLASMNTTATNLNPMPTGVQGARQFYATKFWEQYLPVVNGEVPLVDSLMPDGKETFSEHYGKRIASVTSQEDGIVTAVDDDKITVKGADGKKHDYELVKWFPHNRMSEFSTFPSVEVGQEVKKGDLLAHSNYTDKKTGAFNMGHNMKVAIMPSGDSSNYEDAITISETAAKKLATEQLFGFDVDTKNGVEVNKNRYMSLFPKKFTKDQYDTLDSNGVVKVGTVLHKGDPIIASVGPKLLSAKDAQLGKLSKVLRNSFTDRAEVWEHDWPGTVVDTAITPRGAKVNVVTTPPKQVGDKLCYDPETEVLTVDGWKRICDVSLQDSVATLNPDTGEFRYLHPDKVEAYRHVGDMYRIKSQQIDVLVTPNHRLYVQRRGKNRKFKLEEARDVFGKRVSYKKDGAWVGSEPRFFTFPGMFVGHRLGSVYRDELRMPIETFLMILGMYLSEGSCKKQEGHCYGISIAQKNRENIEEADRALRKAGLGGWSGFEWTLWGKQYYEYFKQFGNAQDKYIPPFVFGLSSRLQRILLKWLMWGDGYSKSGRYVCYTTCSKRLADDVQRLCLHCGYAANVKFSRTKGGRSHGWCVDHELISRFDVHDVRILTTKLTPTVNHSHVREQHTQEECYLKYDGNVYCCTMPKWGVIYVRRNGKAYWCGNSPTNALKGVIGEVRADSEMPRDAYTNEPYEILMNPMGFLSRVAPNQLIEIALAKVAKKTGKQIRLPQLPPEEGWATWAQKQLDAAGVKDSADVFDPRTGKVVQNVGDGYVYMHAFHHLAEKKLSARGDDASYTQDEAPSRGGFSGAKRVSGLSRTALLSHGATENLKDMMTIRGTKNEEYWNKLRLGLPVQEPGVPFIYTKFLESLKAGGINVVEKGDKTSILPLTDKDIDAMSGGRIISSSKMMDADLRPVAGGLFDVGKTGGPDGNRWTAIKLPEPVPNPVMEEPVRRVLGLTVEKLENILAGLEKLDGKTGGEAIKSALEKVDVEQRIKQARQDIVNKRGAARDDAVKVLGYLKSMQEQGLEPKDWMISKVPVIPPKFRPVSKLGDVQLVADLNELYKDVIENAENYSALKGSVADSSLADERLNLYKSVAAAFGLGDPITPEGQAKNIKGAVRQVIGTGSPKFSMFQSKIIAKNLDNVGRGVVIPDENLDMDQIGIPKNIAWEVYKPYVQRSLVRRGYNPVQATRMIDERDRTAESFLREEMDHRPVLMERAPAWHKFNVMAFRPTLVDGNTIRVSPLVDEPYTMDHDGDQVNIHVPSSSKAVKEAYEKMLPSRNLVSLTDLASPRYKLAKEQVLGLYNATQPASNKPTTTFRTVQEAKEAYRKGLIELNDPIRILT